VSSLTEASKIRPCILARLENRSVLDIGCGPEKIVPWAVGVDDSSECRSSADIRANVAPGGDLRDKLSGRLFDVVFSSHTLEHIPDPVAETLRLWMGFVRPGGKLICYLPDERHYRYDPSNPEARNPAHRHLLTFTGFMPVLAGIAGLVVEEARMDLGPGRYSFLVVASRAPGPSGSAPLYP
jgi:SAM-dependent methyltransferase